MVTGWVARLSKRGLAKLELRGQGRAHAGAWARGQNGFAPRALECADLSALCGRRQLAAADGVGRGWVRGRIRCAAPAARTSPLLPQSADKSAHSKARDAREKRGGHARSRDQTGASGHEGNEAARSPERMTLPGFGCVNPFSRVAIFPSAAPVSREVFPSNPNPNTP